MTSSPKGLINSTDRIYKLHFTHTHFRKENGFGDRFPCHRAPTVAFWSRNSFFFLINLFIYLFLAVLGLRFCARAFSSCGERGPLFIVVRGPLTVAASLVAEHRLQTCRLSSCGSWAQLLCGMWDSPRPGLEPASPTLAGGFSTTAPPGKPWSRNSDARPF